MARNTTIKLYKGVPLEKNDENTFFFNSLLDQNAYFASKLFRTLTAMCYHREQENYIRVQMPLSACYDVNYLSFINTDHENKLYYAFVDHVNYISDTVSEIVFTVDYLQTWLFEIKNNLTPCFIERNTTADDSVPNTIKESFDLGEYVINYGNLQNITGLYDLVLVLQASFDVVHWIDNGYLETAKRIPYCVKRTGVTSLFDSTDVVYFEIGTDAQAFNTFFSHVNEVGSGVTINDILSMWLYPKALITGTAKEIINVGTDKNIYYLVNPQKVDRTPSLYLQNFNGYTPKNNKLLQAPYMQIYVENNSGNSSIYDPIYFDDNPSFRVLGTTTPDAKARLIPLKYKGMPTGTTGLSYDVEEGLDSTPFPSMQFLSDAYLVWLAQNRHTVDADLVGQSINTIGSLGVGLSSLIANTATANLGGAVASVSGIASTLNGVQAQIAKFEDAKIQPATAKGNQSEGLSGFWDKIGFSICVKCIDTDHAKSIDSFYTMYGYPVKHIETPKLNNRSRFTYIKTTNFKTNGQIPQNEKNIINSYFNNGVRFWNDRVHFENYDVDTYPNNEY